MVHFEIWLAELPAIAGSNLKNGRRPVVILSDDTAADEIPFVTIIPLTKDRTSPQLPSHVLLCGRYLDHPSRVLCEQVMTLDKSRLIRRIGYVEDAFDRFALTRALGNYLSLNTMQAIYIQEDNIYEHSGIL